MVSTVFSLAFCFILHFMYIQLLLGFCRTWLLWYPFVVGLREVIAVNYLLEFGFSRAWIKANPPAS